MVGGEYKSFGQLDRRVVKATNFTGSLTAAQLTALLYSSKLFINPAVSGTGINTKNFLALSHRLPLIITEKGARGLGFLPGGTAGSGITVCTRAAKMAQAITMLHSQANIWKFKQQQMSEAFHHTCTGIRKPSEPMERLVKAACQAAPTRANRAAQRCQRPIEPPNGLQPGTIMICNLPKFKGPCTKVRFPARVVPRRVVHGAQR